MAEGETIAQKGLTAFERIKNKFKFQVWNPITGRDGLAKVTKVGDEEPLPQLKYKDLEVELSNRLTLLQEIEDYFGDCSDEEKLPNGKPGAWYNLSLNIYSEMGPYTPDVAITERKLLEEGTMNYEWASATKDDILEEMTDKEILEKWGFETWPFPVKMIDGSTKIYKFPIPRGVPLVFERGDIQIVRYYGRQNNESAKAIYLKFFERIMSDLKEQTRYITNPAHKDDWLADITKVESALNEVVGSLTYKISKEREKEFRKFLEKIAIDYKNQIDDTISSIIQHSPARRGNVKYERTFHTIKTCALPIRIKGEKQFTAGEIKAPKGIIPEGEDPSKYIVPGEYKGEAEIKFENLKFASSNPVQDQDYVTENIIAGFIDNDLEVHKLPDDFNQKEEIAPGFDEFGEALEVTNSSRPKVFIDKETGKSSRNWPSTIGKQKTVIEEGKIVKKPLKRKDFIKRQSGIEIVNLIHNEWDTYRDDLRDGRWHPNSPTALDYAMAASPSNAKEFERYDSVGEESGELIKRRIHFKNINKNTRGYKMEICKDGVLDTYNGIRVATNLSPALKIDAKQSMDHPGRLYWHAWPQKAAGDKWGINCEKAPDGIITTRGVSMFLVDELTRNMKFKSHLDSTFETYEKGFDYGPRLIMNPFVKNPHNFKNINDLNAKTH